MAMGDVLYRRRCLAKAMGAQVRLNIVAQLLAEISPMELQQDEDDVQHVAGVVNRLRARLGDDLTRPDPPGEES